MTFTKNTTFQKNEFVSKEVTQVHVPNFFGRVSGSEDRGGGDNGNQFINIGGVGEKSFKEWRRKIGEWKVG